jgi:hypothetical protein
MEKKTRCENGRCKNVLVDAQFQAVVAYCCSAAILAAPIYNSFSNRLQNIASFWDYRVSILGIGLCCLAVFCGYFGSKLKYDNAHECLIGSCGIPGFALAVLNSTKVVIG